MISIDEMEKMLDEIAAGFPPEIFKELNGGIILLPDAKRSPAGRDLFTLGTYFRGGNLGRYIAIYYGSFKMVYGDLDIEQLKVELTHTLKHEFTHHVESLAGEKGLEIKDAEYLADYLRNNQRHDGM